MFYIFSKILAIVSDPMIWMILLFLLAIVLKRRKLKKRFFWAGIIVALVFGNGAFINLAEQKWSGNYKSLPDTTVIYEYALVQGGFSSYNPVVKRPQIMEASERFTESIRLYRLGKVKKLFFTGDNSFGNKDYPESKAIFIDYLKSMGINENDVVLDSQAKNTRQNALRAAELLGPDFTAKQSLLITGAAHMPRALACYKKIGLNPLPYPTNIPIPYKIQIDNFWINSGNFARWNPLIHEIIGLFTYKIMGYI